MILKPTTTTDKSINTTKEVRIGFSRTYRRTLVKLLIKLKSTRFHTVTKDKDNPYRNAKPRRIKAKLTAYR